MERARRIVRRLARYPQIQVRLYSGQVYIYPHPAPRGWGTRGELIAIYARGADPEWIAEDIQFALSDK